MFKNNILFNNFTKNSKFITNFNYDSTYIYIRWPVW